MSPVVQSQTLLGSSTESLSIGVQAAVGIGVIFALCLCVGMGAWLYLQRRHSAESNRQKRMSEKDIKGFIQLGPEGQVSEMDNGKDKPSEIGLKERFELEGGWVGNDIVGRPSMTKS
jgi:hypothetical protein